MPVLAPVTRATGTEAFFRARRSVIGRSAVGLPRGDLAAPGAALAVPRLDQILEAHEVAADAARVESGGGADQLAEALGLVTHREPHVRARLADRLERHGA